MKKPTVIDRNHSASNWKRRLITSTLLGGFMFASVAQEVLLKEDFNTDGAGTRYTIEGGGKSELADHPNNGIGVDQTGPVYWARSSEVSIVGVPGPTPARRVILAWDSAIPADQISPDFFKLFDSVVNWATKGKAKATVLLSPAGIAPSLAARLQAAGHTIVDDDPSIPSEQVVADLILRGNGAGDSSRLANAKIPMIAFTGTDADDLLVSTIGVAQSFEAGNATIVAAAHPAAGGITGSFKIATGTYNWETMGALFPVGATTLATMEQIQPPSARTLADVDGMIAGTKQSIKATENTFTELDIGDNAAGSWAFDWFAPGGLTGVWGLSATGKITVSTAGTYSFAVGADDGARLRIDADNNGFTDSDTVAGGDGVATYYGDKQLAAGTYDYQVVAYNSGGPGLMEVSVSKKAGGADTTPVVDGGTWELLGLSTGAVKLSGVISFTSYEPSGPPDTTKIPLIVLINGGDEGGSVYGGGPFGNFEGSDYFAGSALNKFTGADGIGSPKVLTLNPVNVTGKTNLKLNVLASGTYLDFETSDYLDFKVGESGADPASFRTLIHFTAPTGSDKYFDNRSTQPGNVTRLGLPAQEISADIPSGYNNLVVRVEAVTTWWNEIVAFDNIRITSGAIAPPPPPPPFDGITADKSAGPSLAIPGTGLKGEYWQRGVNTIATDGNTVDANRIDAQIAGFGAASGTFTAKVLNYTGNDLSEMPAWLGDDAGSFSGTPGNLDDGAFRFSGFINIAAPGKINIGTTSDDGTRIKIAGKDVINNDGGHGDATVDADVAFEAAGVYPIEVTYFNGDWTSDGDNHSGNPDPSVHGGANFHLRVAGANVTADTAKMFFTTADGIPAATKGSIAFVSFHDSDDTPDATAAGVGLTEASDRAYTDLLKANGYNVTRFLTANDVDVTTLPPADLIIISRAVSSAHFQQANETAAWNGISKPVMILGGYILRNNRLGFTTGGTMVDTVGDIKLTVTDPSHPIFAGVSLDANNTMANVFAGIESFLGQDPPLVQRGISVNNNPVAGNGMVLATVATADDPTVGGMIIGEWKAGSVMSNGSADVLGGSRLVFLTGSREASGFTGGNAAGFYDLEADGEKMFLNAVAYMSGLGTAGGGPSFSGITLSGGNLAIQWSGGGTLETATSITGPWAAVAGASSPHTAPASGAGAFFRVRQ